MKEDQGVQADLGRSEKRLEQQFAFIKRIDEEKEIYRQTYIADGSRRENDAEHAWHMGVMALLLADHMTEPVDLLSVISMLLIHDIVEVEAGDTYAYDEEARKSQKAREEAAASQVFGLLPADQAEKMLALWHEFEAGETAESRYAQALDRLQPLMLNALSGGKSWREHGVKLHQILERNQKTAENTGALWEYCRQTFLEPHLAKGNIINE